MYVKIAVKSAVFLQPYMPTEAVHASRNPAHTKVWAVAAQADYLPITCY